MRKFRLFGGLLAAVLVWGAASAQELRTFRFGTIGEKPTAANELFFALALEKGWFKEAGIDFKPLRMQPNVAYPSLASGDIEGTYFAASAAVAALRGAPLAVVYYPQYSVDWSLVVDPKKVKTPKDLAGVRCVASSGAKSATQIAWAAMIASVGGDPKNFQAIGLGQPPPFWIEALRVGTAECMMGYDAAWAGQAKREGFNVLAELPNVKPMQSHGLAVSKTALGDAKKRELIVDVLGVFLRTQDYIKANRAEAAETVRRWMGSIKGIETEDYLAAVDSSIKLTPPKGHFEDEKIMANMLNVAMDYGIYDPKEFREDPRTVDLVKVGAIDQSLVKEAYARGAPAYHRR